MAIDEEILRGVVLADAKSSLDKFLSTITFHYSYGKIFGEVPYLLHPNGIDYVRNLSVVLMVEYAKGKGDTDSQNIAGTRSTGSYTYTDTTKTVSYDYNRLFDTTSWSSNTISTTDMYSNILYWNTEYKLEVENAQVQRTDHDSYGWPFTTPNYTMDSAYRGYDEKLFINGYVVGPLNVPVVEVGLYLIEMQGEHIPIV